MIECVLLSIGEELLEGSVVDTNSAFIASRLMEKGISPRRIQMLPDDMEVLVQTIRQLMDNYPLVITTGGLGPTFDDLTIEAVARACDTPLVLFEEARQHIVSRLSRLNVTINEYHFKQAMLPENCRPFPNENGTAYGFSLKYKNAQIITMPGVPSEMKLMLVNQVIPYLEKDLSLNSPYKIDLRFGRTPESEVDEVIRELGIPAGTTCIINASLGEVTVKIRSDANKNEAAEFAGKIRSRLARAYVGQDDETSALVLARKLREKGLTLSVAESCTGGMLGAEITTAAGVSDVFAGGIISYDNRIKQELLGVEAAVLEKYGAVSRECAQAMAGGVQALLGTDCAISITGIAGPGGGSKEKPVGMVWIGIAVRDKIEVHGLQMGVPVRIYVRERLKRPFICLWIC